ncbi:MAG: chemotaxis-specific protein-glutamate methyltransferase CheB [Nitrospirae bacterium]|nr:chemotaxis-specific protein-glutamate methyltransferase CheB [Nitrospirota bacterium]
MLLNNRGHVKRNIRVLIVDDSGFTREVLSSILSSDDEILVVGEAANGREAVKKVRTLSPDVVTMDIEMPIMNGIEAIEKIMSTTPVPIMAVTSLDDVNTAYMAISKGALDVFLKPGFDEQSSKSFIQKLKLLSRYRLIGKDNGLVIPKTAISVIKLPIGTPGALEVHEAHEAHEALEALDISKLYQDSCRKIIAIASSTGGPKALAHILPYFPQSFPYPVVIAQHISDGFVSGMVEWLKTICKIDIKVAENGEYLKPSTVYVNPSEWNMIVTSGKSIELQARQSNNIYHPSCNVLLTSAADAFRQNTLGIILSGMGKDGVDGMKKIKESGGTTIAQDETTSVVFGMNKAAIDEGTIDKVLPASAIGKEILSVIKLI